MARLRVAAAQFAPCFLDTAAALVRAAELIGQAGREAVQMLVFPETWLQGYPYFAGAPRSAEFRWCMQRLAVEAIAVPGPETARLGEAAARARCVVVISTHERDGGTLYNTSLTFGADGRLLGRHRKLMPTANEKLVWGMGDGSDLEAHDTAVGRVSGLICFEHHMALARYALASLGVQLHAAVFPGHPFLDGVIDAVTRQTAFENGCFVILAREVMSRDRLPAAVAAQVSSEPQWWLAHGGSAIIGPGGEAITPPVFDAEQLVIGEVDLDAIARAKLFFDGTGHYSRPDVFRLVWDRRPKRAVERLD